MPTDSNIETSSTPTRDKHLMDYRNGESSPLGDTIEFIIHQSNDLLVFINDKGGLGWRYSDNNEKTILASSEALKLLGIVDASVHRMHWRECRVMIGRALSTSIHADVKKIPSKFVSTAKHIKKRTKNYDGVAYSGPDYIIYKLKKGGYAWWHKSLPDYLNPAVNEYSRLSAIARVSLPKKYRQAVSRQLANCIYSAFRKKENEDVLADYAQVERFINERAKSYARYNYFLYNIIFAAFISLTFTYFYLALSLPVNLKELSASVTFGMLGALVSTLQRSDKIEIDYMTPVSSTIIQGITKLIMGMLSGLFMFFILKSKIVLGITAENVYSMGLLSVAAGFSERYIPDILSNISKTKSGSSPEQNVSTHQ